MDLAMGGGQVLMGDAGPEGMEPPEIEMCGVRQTDWLVELVMLSV